MYQQGTLQLVLFWHCYFQGENHMVLRATESKHPAAKGLHCLAPSEILDRLLAAQRTSLASISSALPMIAQAATAAADALQAGGKMAYAGAGSAGLMALSDGL